MVTNTTVEVDGVTYIFDENGVGSVYVEPTPEEVEVPVEEETVSGEAAEETTEAAEDAE